MGYDLSAMADHHIERLTKGIPFGLKPYGWDEILVLARRELKQPEFDPTRIWIVVDDENSDKTGLVLEDQASETTCVLDIERPTLTETQVSLLKLLHFMTTPEYSID